jgi:hypothetical protein
MMSHRSLLSRTIADSLSEVAAAYFLNTTERGQWVDYAEEHGIAKAIAKIEEYAMWFANGEKQDA